MAIIADTIPYVQDSNTLNPNKFLDIDRPIEPGRLIAIDPGTKRTGVAVCDEGRMVSRPLDTITMSSWKSFLLQIRSAIDEFDAKAVIIGLPLASDGSESEMSAVARDMARKFDLSLDIPVFLQDERVSTWEARRRTWLDSKKSSAADRVDSVAAVIILEDFLDRLNSASKGSQNV